jgi:mono/diheme cytochrome c family protein
LTAQSCVLPCKDPSPSSYTAGNIFDDRAPTENPWATAARSADSGNNLFAENCASCHGAHGSGGGIGPSLLGEHARKSRTALVAWIKNPQPPLPRLYPSPLTEQDVEDVASYVASL